MKQLELLFKSADNKNRTLRLKDPKEGLAPETVQQAMNRIVQADAFYLDDAKQYDTPVGARYVERIVTDIFTH